MRPSLRLEQPTPSRKNARGPKQSNMDCFGEVCVRDYHIFVAASQLLVAYKGISLFGVVSHFLSGDRGSDAATTVDE